MSRASKLNEVEEFPKRIKIFLILIVMLFSISTIGFKLMDHSSYLSAFIRSLETLAFMFKDDSTLSERFLEIFLAIVGVFLIWWVLWSTADLAINGSLKRYLKRRFYLLKMKRVKDHIIIIGGGRVGEETAKAISKKNKNFVIVDSNEQTVKALRKKGYNVIEGNAEEEETLKEVKIEKAKKVIITLPKTETNILITLSIKDLNPKVEIYARAENTSLISKLKRAGAKVVIIPEIVAGDKIAEDIL